MTPYSDLDLEAMMADLESELVERKESLRKAPPGRDGPIERIRQAVCAFANDLPGHGRAGVVFVGARDDGTPPSPIDSSSVWPTSGAMGTRFRRRSCRCRSARWWGARSRCSPSTRRTRHRCGLGAACGSAWARAGRSRRRRTNAS